MKHKKEIIDPADPNGRLELAAAFGWPAAWDACIKVLTTREAKETDRRRKARLRLMLLNAQTQYEVVTSNT